MIASRSALRFENAYEKLPPRFFARVEPLPVRAPRLIVLNASLCAELQINQEDLAPFAAEIFSGNQLPPGAASLAQAYAGHQFGSFVPQLGDGRALLLGEVRDVHGRMRDIQLKGSGPTPFSRRGDGRSTLASVLREYLVSEGMHALGVPSTRALAAVASGDLVFREGPEPGAVFTRVAHSHVRVGTFEYFAARKDTEALDLLAHFVIKRHYPECAASENPYAALLEAFMQRYAALVARWMALGFVHGVMNTDNTALSGETLDFGPCAFLDVFRHDMVFSAIDRAGRYAYRNQPVIAHWNLARLAETLLPLIDTRAEAALERASVSVHRFPLVFREAWLHCMRPKLGLLNPQEGDFELCTAFLDALQEEGADFTRSFHRLYTRLKDGDGTQPDEEPFFNSASYARWAPVWRARLGRQAQSTEEAVCAMRKANPFLIVRNHRVAEAISAAVENADFLPFERLLKAVQSPFAETDDTIPFAQSPQPHERVLRTYCGT